MRNEVQLKNLPKAKNSSLRKNAEKDGVVFASRTILLSFDTASFRELESGNMVFEYRSVLPEQPVSVYFYVTRPTKAICGYAQFGCRELLADWLTKYKSRSSTVISRIRKYLADCKYAAPILKFQHTKQISLDELKQDFGTFVVPRMYYFIDGTPLHSYLKEKLVPIGEVVTNTFADIPDSAICP